MRRLLPLRSIEVVEDRTAQSRCDEEFPRIARPGIVPRSEEER